MGRKKILEKRKARLQAKINEMTARSTAADITVEELRSIHGRIMEVREDLAEVEEELESLPDEDPAGDEGEGRDAGGVMRQNVPEGAEMRGGNPLASYSNLPVNGQCNEGRELSPYATTEYRMAFKDYVQRGISIPSNLTQRAGGDPGPTVAADIGAIIPETILNEFIKEVSKVYGHIYSKVRKLNVQGGVKIPISKLSATFKWITETTVSKNQKAGDIKEFLTFDYNIGEIRVSQTLLSQVVSLSLFESEVVRVMLKAYVEVMDKGIISGTGTGQLLGITKDPRVTKVIEMTEADLSDWTAWRKKLFAVVPLSKRGHGEFLFPCSTVESYLMTMKDKNDRPLWRDPDNGMSENGTTAGKFFGRLVDYVEPDVIADFDTAAEGDVIGIFWNPQDYAINTNMVFGMKRYFDDDTNEWINKALTIVDGKIIDPAGCYLIKKKATASQTKA